MLTHLIKSNRLTCKTITTTPITSSLIANKLKRSILNSGEQITIAKIHFVQYKPLQVYQSILPIFLEDMQLHSEYSHVSTLIQSNINYMLLETLNELDKISVSSLILGEHSIYSKITIQRIDDSVSSMLRVFNYVNNYLNYLEYYYIATPLQKIDINKMYDDLLSFSNIYYIILGRVTLTSKITNSEYLELEKSLERMKVVLKHYNDIYANILQNFMEDSQTIISIDATLNVSTDVSIDATLNV